MDTPPRASSAAIRRQTREHLAALRQTRRARQQGGLSNIAESVPLSPGGDDRPAATGPVERPESVAADLSQSVTGEPEASAPDVYVPEDTPDDGTDIATEIHADTAAPDAGDAAQDTAPVSRTAACGLDPAQTAVPTETGAPETPTAPESLAPVPEAEAAPVPEAEAAPVPEAESAPVPEAESAPVPGDKTAAVASAETATLVAEDTHSANPPETVAAGIATSPDPAAPDATGHDSDLFRLPGAGPGLVWMLERVGVPTLADLAKADADTLERRLGVLGEIFDMQCWIDMAKAESVGTDAAPQPNTAAAGDP